MSSNSPDFTSEIPQTMTGKCFLNELREVNEARNQVWANDTKIDPLFHAVELGGEVGELLNEVKKLHRETVGWRGSTTTMEKLSEEIGDVLICLDKLAAIYGIDLAEATRQKFNTTSDKYGFPHKLSHRE
jgi:NTP pyrophosphatase (non-canonical NTP hydrolase)